MKNDNKKELQMTYKKTLITNKVKYQVESSYLVIFEQLQPLQFKCWSNQISVYVKWYWFEMNSFQ